MMCHKLDAHEAFPLYGSHICKTWATSALVWGGFIQQFLERNLFPFLDQDCSPSSLAEKCLGDAYPSCGVFGAFPLAARLLLHDKALAIKAFNRNPGAKVMTVLMLVKHDYSLKMSLLI